MNQDEPKLIANLIRTPDGTILQSFNRHDYKEYKDANGEFYMVDGGLDYTRRIVGQNEPYEELSIYSDAHFDVIREYFRWGTYGKNGDQPIRYVALADMSNAHIEACLVNLILHPLHKKLFNEELELRNKEGFHIYD